MFLVFLIIYLDSCVPSVWSVSGETNKSSHIDISTLLQNFQVSSNGVKNSYEPYTFRWDTIEEFVPITEVLR